MNFNNYTVKSQEAIQKAIEIANGVGSLNHIDAADIDDNGSLDLITASGGNQLMWLRNLGLPRNEIQGKVTLDYDNNGCNELYHPDFLNAFRVNECEKPDCSCSHSG